LEEVCTLQAELIESKQAAVFWGEMPVVLGSKTPLFQIFQNLISNAVKYSKEGVPPEVKISCIEYPTHWEFKVQDNGIGIEADSLDKIFVIFQRLHTKDQYAGTGIGLAIVKKLVENLGGKISVESTPGVGTVFSFTLRK
jgi:signal transduction histidine kinase